MMQLLREPKWFDAKPEHVSEHNDDKTLAWKRGDLLFILNFHGTQSFRDWPVWVESGVWQLVLDTDAAQFGGHDRVAADQRFTVAAENGNFGKLLLYAPSYTGLVLRKVL
jgi:1,4-alpha-glucan branching enzyme